MFKTKNKTRLRINRKKRCISVEGVILIVFCTIVFIIHRTGELFLVDWNMCTSEGVCGRAGGVRYNTSRLCVMLTTASATQLHYSSHNDASGTLRRWETTHSTLKHKKLCVKMSAVEFAPSSITRVSRFQVSCRNVQHNNSSSKEWGRQLGSFPFVLMAKRPLEAFYYEIMKCVRSSRKRN